MSFASIIFYPQLVADDVSVPFLRAARVALPAFHLPRCARLRPVAPGLRPPVASLPGAGLPGRGQLKKGDVAMIKHECYMNGTVSKQHKFNIGIELP